jgi:hypothetical protein
MGNRIGKGSEISPKVRKSGKSERRLCKRGYLSTPDYSSGLSDVPDFRTKIRIFAP